MALPNRAGHPWGDALLMIPLPPELERAIPKRQAEYRAGRYCACAALSALGADPGVPGRDASGIPRWPARVVGSITHTDGYARAAVAWSASVTAIGVDTERVMTADRTHRVAPAIAGPAELAIAASEGLDPSEALTLMFSAKESAFKCLYPLIGRRFGFSDARLTRLSVRAGTFSIELATTLSPEYSSGTVLDGCCQIEGDLIHTGILVRERSIRTAHQL